MGLLRKIFVALAIVFFATNAQAATITASSCAYENVLTAVNAASTDDTVAIPAGECTWTRTLAINKKITLQGAGVGATKITGSTTIINSSASGVRITGIEFIRASGLSYFIMISDTNWRVDNCKFHNGLSAASGLPFAVAAHGQNKSMAPTGVIDNNQMHRTKVDVSSLSTQYAQWSADNDPSNATNKVFVEDNVFTTGDGYYGVVTDGGYGGRLIVRYNDFIGDGAYQQMLVHGVQMKNNRSTKYWQFYGNDYQITNANSYAAPYKLRGGTGLVFYNRIGGTGVLTPNAVWLEIERANREKSTAGKCDGSHAFDGNTAILADDYGYGGVGTHTGANNAAALTDSEASWTASKLIGITIYNVTDGSKCLVSTNTGTTVTCTLSGGTENDWDTGDEYKITNGYPCLDNIGRGLDATEWNATQKTWVETTSYPLQTLEPVVAWVNKNNANGNVPIALVNSTDQPIHIKANRDYYDYNASFTGTSGTGCGTIGTRPATCVTGVYYWATNQSCSDISNMVGAKPENVITGTLYKCTDTDTWEEYFTPYDYPHPLRGEGGESGTTPPTVTSFYIYAETTVINFSEVITATSGAAFTVAGLASAMTLTCPAVSTAASSMTCTNSRTVYQAEGNGTYGYTGTKVIDAAENALATIDNSPTAVNLSTEVETPPAVRLTVNKTGSGCTITSSPSGIIAGTTTTADYDTGTVVTLGGYVEHGWNPTIVFGGDCASNGTVTMSGAKTCTATCTEKKVLKWAR